MNKYCSLLLSVVFIICFSSFGSDVAAQSSKRRQQQAAPAYYLPKAGFQNLSGSSAGSNDLPVMSGVHLQEGLDRRPNDPNVSQPYDPGEPSLNMALVRWDKKRFPLRVFITEGKMLPSVPFEALQQDRVPRVEAMLVRNPAGIDELPTAPGWKSEMNEAVASGFEQWRELSQEGVISFGFVDNPAQADIIVFFADRFPGAAGPGGTDVHANTCGQVFTAEQVAQKNRLGQPPVPIVIEFKTSEEYGRLQAEAAHEFGHALGIKAHSPYRQDIMYVNRIVDSLSPADKATLRALYQRTPKYWYY